MELRSTEIQLKYHRNLIFIARQFHFIFFLYIILCRIINQKHLIKAE